MIRWSLDSKALESDIDTKNKRPSHKLIAAVRLRNQPYIQRKVDPIYLRGFYCSKTNICARTTRTHNCLGGRKALAAYSVGTIRRRPSLLRSSCSCGKRGFAVALVCLEVFHAVSYQTFSFMMNMDCLCNAEVVVVRSRSTYPTRVGFWLWHPPHLGRTLEGLGACMLRSANANTAQTPSTIAPFLHSIAVLLQICSLLLRAGAFATCRMITAFPIHMRRFPG